MKNENVLNLIDNNETENTDETPEEENEDTSNSDDKIKEQCFSHAFFLPVDDIKSIRLNPEEFADGVNSVSYLCGQIIGLTSVGVSISDAFNYVTQKEASDNILKSNEAVSDSNNKAIIESSKYGHMYAQSKNV